MQTHIFEYAYDQLGGSGLLSSWSKRLSGKTMRPELLISWTNNLELLLGLIFSEDIELRTRNTIRLWCHEFFQEKKQKSMVLYYTGVIVFLNRT